MMAQTPRLRMVYPEQGENPFYTSMKSFFESVDSYVFANMADRNMFLRGGGTIVFDALSGLVSWSSPLLMLDGVSGFAISVAADNLTLADGQFAVLDSVRVLSQGVSATLSAVATVGVGEGKIAIFKREGNYLVIRGGMVVGSGFSGRCIELGGTAEAQAESGLRSGTETFGGTNAYVDVLFSTVFSDTNYRVEGLVGDAAFAFYAPAANRTASGFRIVTVDSSVPLNGDKVDWKVVHN